MFRNFISTLKRNTTSVVLNAIGLSVAFTAFMIIFMRVDFEMGYDKFHPKKERIFRVEIIVPGENMIHMPLQLIEEFENSSPHIEASSLIHFETPVDATVIDENGVAEMFRLSKWGVGTGFPDIFDLQMAEGTADAIEAPGVVLIPLSAAEKIFPGQAGNIAGNRLGNWTVGGVYRDFPDNSVIKNNLFYRFTERTGWTQFNYHLFVLLDSPASKDTVEEILSANENLETSYEAGARIRLTRITDVARVSDIWHDKFEKVSMTSTYILMLIALLVLGIAIINYINFSSALTPIRLKSINTQKILGATNGMLRARLILEAVLISLASYLLALLLVYSLSRTSLAQYLLWDLDSAMRPAFLVKTAFIALAVGFLAGVFPAWQMTSVPPVMAIKGSFGSRSGKNPIRTVLIGTQFVVSTFLIIVTLILNMQLLYMKNYETGFDKSQVAYFEISEDMVSSREAISSEIRKFGNIEDVAFAYQHLALGDEYGENWGVDFRTDEYLQFAVMPVTWNFFDVMGINVADGRKFTSSDELREEVSYIFNYAAKEYYDLKLGEKVSKPGYSTYGEIIGITDKDFQAFSLRISDNPLAFCLSKSFTWAEKHMTHCYVRTTPNAKPQEIVGSIQKALDTVQPGYPSVDVKLMDEVAQRAYNREQQLSTLISFFSVLAIVISLIGVFGLVLFETQYRRKEIGIRRVMGASTGEILELFNRRFIWILIVSFAIAAPLSWLAADKWLAGFAYRIPVYWWVFLLAAIAVAAVTIATVTLRSWKAASDNPVNSIKTE